MPFLGGRYPWNTINPAGVAFLCELIAQVKGDRVYDPTADIDLLVKTLSNHIGQPITREEAQAFWRQVSHGVCAGWLSIAGADHIIEAYTAEAESNPVVKWELARLG